MSEYFDGVSYELTLGATQVVKFLKKLGRDDSGATAVEYGLIVALIFLAMIGAVNSFAGTTIAMWNTISTTIVTATV
ncbi:Flp family type IVb pilin [Qipengyuania psychrotolerans]|uniref:Flp family type IVb pilin n=1 Tax=Qipengyuania psychrotolerans TaxID=2867238 RepID=UPI0031E981B2